MTRPEHPVGAALAAAVDGRFPPADGRWERVEPWRRGIAGVVAFTGHALVALPPAVRLPPAVGARIDGYGGAHHPQVIAAIAGETGWIDSLDLVLARRGIGGPPALVERPDLAEHPRVRFAADVRDQVRPLGRSTGDGLVTIGRGLGGLWELGVEAPGEGRDLLAAALTLIDADEIVVAAVAPGNARAVRAFLAVGFSPVASVQLARPTPPAPAPRRAP